MSVIFEEADVVFRYTRKQALSDGVLVDISGPAKESGIKFPVAVTQGVFAVLNDTGSPGQDVKGRTWDLLLVFKMNAKFSEGDEIHFSPLFVINGADKAQSIPMWAKCGPGDEGEPVITIMLEGED